MSKLKISDRNSGINALFFGMLFLFSPSVMLFDPFPDFIGYAFMIYGLTRLRDLSPELSTARRGFGGLRSAIPHSATIYRRTTTRALPQRPMCSSDGDCVQDFCASAGQWQCSTISISTASISCPTS